MNIVIVGIGLDIIEMSRIEESIQKSDRLIKRILTQKEQKVCAQRSSHRRKVEFVAGRFAAKEAFAKATGRGIGELSFQHIEILSHANGKPELTAVGYEDVRIFISITHSRDYAAAQVIIEE